MTHVKFDRSPFEGTFTSLVDDLFTELPVLYKNGQTWKGTVPVNIKETENNYSIEVIAPGFEKTDFKVSLDQQVLTIWAEKKAEVIEDAGLASRQTGSQGSEKQIRREYSYRSFKRSFTLNEKTDGTTIDAKYINGVLLLNLPKKEVVKPSVQEINIQ